MSLLQKKPYTLDSIVRAIITVSTFAIIIYVLGLLKTVLIPFALAFIIAYIINPFIKIIQEKLKIKNRLIAVLLGLSIINGGLYLFWMLLTPLLMIEINQTIVLIQKHLEAINIINFLPIELQNKIDTFFVSDEFKNALNVENIQNLSDKYLPKIWSIFSDSFSFIIGLLSIITIFLYTFFILLDFQNVIHTGEDLLPKNYRETIIHLIQDFNHGMHTYFRAQFLVAAIVGVLFAIGFSIIDLPLGIILGLFIGVLNIIPYLQLAGFIPAFSLAFLHAMETNQSFWVVAGLVLLVFAVVQLIQEAILVPKILGEATGMNPAFVLLSLSVWGSLLGVLGLLIALPTTTVLIKYYQRYIND